MVQRRLSIRKGLSCTRKLITKLPPFVCLVMLCLPFLSACQNNKPLQTLIPTAMAQPTAVIPAELPPGDTTHLMTYAGIERSYILHVPPGMDGTQSLPLVLAFHGITLNANEMIRISGLNDQSDTSGFLVVYPNGTGENTSWNGGQCCGEAAKNNVDDIGFVRALVEELSTTTNIDPKRILCHGLLQRRDFHLSGGMRPVRYHRGSQPAQCNADFGGYGILQTSPPCPVDSFSWNCR